MSTAVTPEPAPAVTPQRASWITGARDRLGGYSHALRKLGVAPTATLLHAHIDRLRHKGKGGEAAAARALHMRGYPHPLYFRPGTSDLFVVQQIFVKEEYLCVADEPDVEFIVDCGANIGCSAVYFLNRYPGARLIAVEADPGNAAVCRTNVSAYGDRAEVLNAGIWPRDADLKVESNCGDGLEWSFQVRPVREGETADIRAVGIPGLLERSPSGRIDILKIDIEHAERELFSEGAEAWLPFVRTLAIELHSEECIALFRRAVDPLGFAIRHSGELTIATRRPG